MNIPIPSPGLASLLGHTQQYLSPETVDKCVNARGESEIASLWERVKDWFLGTNVVAARLAVFELANAQTTHTQFEAFVRLTDYIDPQQFDQLQWCIGHDDSLTFKIGDHVLATTLEWASQAPMTWGPHDMASLLLSLRHNDLRVVEQLRDIGASRIYEQAVSAAAGNPVAGIDITADVMLDAQRWYLSGKPSLVNALEIIGMHRNDDRGDLAFELNEAVGKLRESAFEEDDDTTATVSRSAENLMCLVTDMFHDREHLKRVQQSINFPG